jgi:phage baseplate assembly protein W
MPRIDIDLNFTAHPLTGDLATKTDRSAVDQSVRNLILTEFYERGFNIEVGSNVTDALFENFTALTQQTLKNNIIRVLRNFEPGVEIVDVIAEMDRPNELKVEIYYNYLNNPEVRKVVIPIQRLI